VWSFRLPSYLGAQYISVNLALRVVVVRVVLHIVFLPNDLKVHWLPILF